jgi:hypothetical protein
VANTLKLLFVKSGKKEKEKEKFSDDHVMG